MSGTKRRPKIGEIEPGVKIDLGKPWTPKPLELDAAKLMRKKIVLKVCTEAEFMQQRMIFAKSNPRIAEATSFVVLYDNGGIIYTTPDRVAQDIVHELLHIQEGHFHD